MTVLGEAVVRIRAETTGVAQHAYEEGVKAGRAFAKGTQSGGKGAFSGVEKELNQATRGAVAGSGAFTHLGRSLAFAGATFLGTAKAVDLFRQSIASAADEQKQMERSATLFKGSADEVKRFSDSAAKSLGLSSGAAQKFANDLGQMLVPLKETPGTSAATSIALTKLAANLASLRHEDPSSVFAKLTAALRGRGAALRTYGIDLNEATVKEKALSLGLVAAAADPAKVALARRKLQEVTVTLTKAEKDYAGQGNTVQVARAQDAVTAATNAYNKALAGAVPQLTANQKQIAILSILMDESSKHAADFSKHSKDLANVQAVLHAEIENTKNSIGVALLPIVTKVTTAMADWLGKSQNQAKVQKFVTDAAKNLSSALGVTWTVLKNGVAVIQPVVDALGGVKKVVEILIAFKLASWAQAAIGSLSATGKAWLGVGASALTAAEETTAASRTMTANMTALGSASTRGATVVAAQVGGIGKTVEAASTKTSLLVSGLSGLSKIGRVAIPIALVTSVMGGGGTTLGTVVQNTMLGFMFGGPEGALAAGTATMVLKVISDDKGKPWWRKALDVATMGAGQLIVDILFRSHGDTSAGPPGPQGPVGASAGSAGVVDKAKELGVGSGAIYAAGGGHGGISKPGEVLDCSGYVYQVFTQSGFEGFPGTSEEQWKTQSGTNWTSRRIGASQAKPGDTVYSRGSSKYPPPGHCGIVTGGSGLSATVMQYYSTGNPADTVKLGDIPHRFGVKRWFLVKQGAGAGGGKGPPGTTEGAPTGAKGPVGGDTTAGQVVASQIIGKVSVGIPAHKKGGAALPAGWAEQVLDGLGAPHTPGNIAFLQAWQQREGGSSENTATYNPLCTTMKGYGGVSINKVGVKAYPSWEQGLAATVATLLLYPAITQALKSGALGKNFRPTEQFAKEFMRWSGGAYSSINVSAPQLTSSANAGNIPGLHTGVIPKVLPPPAIVGQGLVNALAANDRAMTTAGGPGQPFSAMEKAINDRIALENRVIAAANKYLAQHPKQKKAVDDVINSAKADIANLRVQLKQLGVQEAASFSTGQEKAALINQIIKGLGLDPGAMGTRAHEAVADFYAKMKLQTLQTIRQKQIDLAASVKKQMTEGRAVVASVKDVLGTLLKFDPSAIVHFTDQWGRQIDMTVGAIIKKAQLLIRAWQILGMAAHPNPAALAAALAAIRNFFGQIQAAVSAGLSAAAQATATAQSAFQDSFGRLTGMIDEAFDRATQAHIAGMQAAMNAQIQSIQAAAQASITAVQEAAQSQIDSLTKAAEKKIQGLQNQLQNKIKGLQRQLKRETDKLERERAQLTIAERHLEALQAQLQNRQDAASLGDAQTALAQAGIAGDPQAIKDAQRQLDDFLLNQQIQVVGKQAAASRAAEDESVKNRQDALAAQEAAQEESLTKQEAAAEKQINEELQKRIAAINKAAAAKEAAIQAEADAQVAAIQATEAAQEQEYQDERAAAKEQLDIDLANHIAHLMDKTETWEQFLDWLKGKNASGLFGKFLNPVIAMAQGGDAQGKAFYDRFARWLAQAAADYNAFLAAVAAGTPASGPSGNPGTSQSNAVGANSGSSGSGVSCFVAGTMITTPDGDRPIEELKVGDVVLTWDFLLEQPVETKVVDTFVHVNRATLYLNTLGGNVQTTAEHPFWTGREWVEAGDLCSGQTIVGLHGPWNVLSCAPGALATVYNIHVDHPDHNYFADGFLVHNKIAKFLTGGEVPGPYNERDDKWALVSGGETVIDRRLTNALKAAFLGPPAKKGGGGDREDRLVEIMRLLLQENKKHTDLLDKPPIHVTTGHSADRIAFEATR